MSYDLALPTLCNHRVDRELTYLASDLRSVRVSQPMSSTMTVAVFASNNKVSPSIYDIIDDPTAEAVNPPKMISFKRNWLSPTDTFEVSYNTFSFTCPKCVGGGVIHDISYSNIGSLSLNRNENLLLQNIEKFVVTEINSNPFYSYIGTNLVGLLGEKIYDMGYIRTRITQEIMTSLDRFKDLQSKYASTGRPMTAGETLDAVKSVTVTSDEKDPTILRVSVEATALSGKSLTYVQLLKIS